MGMRFCLAVVCFPLLFCAAASAISPEPDSIVLPRLRQKLKGQTELSVRTVKKAGNRTVEFESILCQEGDIKFAPEILANISEYGRWALKNINVHPGGGTYYLQINALTVDPKTPDILKSDTILNLPVFHKEIQREFKMHGERKGDVFTLAGEALPNEKSLIEDAGGYMRVYPAEGMPGRVWIYVHGSATLRNWFIYEALPERLLTSETGERIQIVLDNYLNEEERVRQSKLKPSQSPTEKTAAPDASVASPSRK